MFVVYGFCNESFLGKGFSKNDMSVMFFVLFGFFLWELWVGVIWVFRKRKVLVGVIDRVYKIIG